MPHLQENHILFIDNHLLVINKPAGIITQGAPEGQTSLAQLAKDYLKASFNKPGNVYLGIVSRLDSRVSGVIVLARTSKAAARLNDQFRNRSVNKSYVAIVSGQNIRSLPPTGALEHLIYKDEEAHRMRCLNKNETNISDTKPAMLSYRAIDTHEDQTLVQVSLETGRKHQIRCQFSFIGFPIVGDQKYGSQKPFPGPGIALHSKSLQITHPTLKTNLQFEAEIPKSWNASRFNV